MELISLDCLLGEFRPYYNQGCNFNRIVRGTLTSVEAYISHGKLEKAKIEYDRLINYLEAVKARESIREREFTTMRSRLFLRSNVGPDVDRIIKEYYDSLK